MKNTKLKIVGFLLLILFLAVDYSFAALVVNTATEWYVDATNGLDTNSGDSAAITATATDGVGDGANGFTSVTGGFTGMANRYIYIQFSTPGLYKISSVTNDNTIVLDGAGANESSITWTIGGEWQTVQFALDTFKVGGVTRINLQNTSTYVITATLDHDTTGGLTDAPIIVQGYTTTIGDRGRATIDGNDGDPDAADVLNLAAGYTFFIDLILKDCTDDVINANNINNDLNYFLNCTFSGAADDNYNAPNTSGMAQGEEFLCENTLAGDNGITQSMPGALGEYWCYIHDSAGDGIESTAFFLLNGCIIDTTGGHNILMNNNGPSPRLINCTLYNATGDNFYVAGANAERAFFFNSIFDTASDKNTETVANVSLWFNFNNNFSNGSGGANTATWILDNDEYTSSPGFSGAAGGDFTIDETLKAKGFPTSAYVGAHANSISYLDIGALQRQEPAGGGTGGGASFFSMN